MLQPAAGRRQRIAASARSFELVAVIGRGCGSTAWVLANLAAHHWLLGMWHARGAGRNLGRVARQSDRLGA